MLLEDYKADVEYRQMAAKMAETLITAIPNHKDDIIPYDRYFIMDISKEISTLNKSFKKFDFAVLFSEKAIDDNYSCSVGKLPNKKRKCIFFIFPFLYGYPSDMLEQILYKKHKKQTNELFKKFLKSGKTEYEAYKLITKEGLKYIGEYLIQILKQVLNDGETFSIIFHECIHALDKMRYSDTYVSKEEETDTEEDKNEYYNREDEQHAYLQQTLYIIDEWVKKKYFDRTSFKSFNEFYDMFVSQYRGSYNRLTPSNKRKTQKKLYVYYKHLFSTPKYQSYTNPKY